MLAQHIYRATVDADLQGPAYTGSGSTWWLDWGTRPDNARRRGAGEILPEDRHQHTRHPIAAGADLHVGDELLRIRQRRRKHLWVRVGKFSDGVEHQLELAQLDRRLRP